MMVDIARGALPEGMTITGVTATHSPPMIVTQVALAAAGAEVVEIGLREGRAASGIMIGAFGDPGLAELRRQLSIPVTGLCEASMIEAAKQGRRFGIATSTPDLAESIGALAQSVGVGRQYTGIRLTPGDPVALAAEPERMTALLADAVRECIELDGAEAVIIGGGPLGQAAAKLARMFSVPVIEPIPSSVRRLVAMTRLQQQPT